MRGVPLVILAILILSVPIQIVGAHNEDNKGEGSFDLQASPDKLTVHRGDTVSSVISLNLEQDPSIQIQLTLSWDNRVPSDVSYSFKPSSIGSTQSSVLTFTTQLNSTIGNFHFHVWGTTSNETESVRMSLKIKQFHPHGQGEPDFTVSADPLYLTTRPGGNASSMIIVNSLRGFSAPVDLTVNWENVPTGVSTNLQPSRLTPTGTSNLTLMVGMSAPTGLYGFNVIGTSGSIVHESPDMWLNISTVSSPHISGSKDFTLKVTPNSWTINASETVDYNLTLGSVNGFDQQVSLSLAPSTLQGATLTFSSTAPTVSSLPVLVQLHIQTTKTIKNDTYSFTIKATNGTLTHQASIFLIVLPASKVPPPAVLLTLSLSRYNITVGDTIRASGLLSPRQGLANTPILLLYTEISNVQWKVLNNILTNTTAGYSSDWTPSQTGTFLVRAIWVGNATNTGALSNLAILTVMPTSPSNLSTPEFPWFWLAIAAIIIIGIATAVTLRIRKKPITTPVKP
jgi:hypothetical protein